METLVPTSSGCMIPAPSDFSAYAIGFASALSRFAIFECARATTVEELLASLQSDADYAADEDLMHDQWRLAQSAFTEEMLQLEVRRDEFRASEELARVYLISLCSSGAELKAVMSEVLAVLAERDARSSR